MTSKIVQLHIYSKKNSYLTPSFVAIVSNTHENCQTDRFFLPDSGSNGHDIRKNIYEQAADFTLDDVVKFQQEKVKDRKYRIVILGRESDMDLEVFGKYGKITHLSLEDIFGY